MDEVIRWPGVIYCNNSTRNIHYSHDNLGFVSYQGSSSQVVACLFAPASPRRIMQIDMMVAYRQGQTPNVCQFSFATIKNDTGDFANQLFNTVPPILDPQDATLFPLRKWRRVFTRAPGTAPTVYKNQYLGVIFSGIAGPHVAGTNDMSVHPMFEVLLL